MAKINPFLYYSRKLDNMFKRASRQKQPALWLYNNKVRTYLFMIEALCRLLSKDLQNEHFSKWLKAFKKLEDELGEVDFYDGFIKEFSQNRNIPPAVLYYLHEKRDKALKKFARRVAKENYLTEGCKAFITDFKKHPVNFDAAFIARLSVAIRNEFEKAVTFAAAHQYNFTELEDQVHELRRKLRWMGIYSVALRGVVSLKDSRVKYKWEQKYLTPKILTSPFNKLPVNRTFPAHIYYDRKHFYALNWIIDQLGILKDDALKIEILSKALRKTENSRKEEAEKKAMQLLGARQSETAILMASSRMAKEFFAVNKIQDNFFGSPKSRPSRKTKARSLAGNS